MFCVHKRGTVLTLPDWFRGTGDLPYPLLGVLKVKKRERQLEKVEAYSAEESEKEEECVPGLETYTQLSQSEENLLSPICSTQLSLHSQAHPSARSHTTLPHPTLMERGKRKRCWESEKE